MVEEAQILWIVHGKRKNDGDGNTLYMRECPVHHVNSVCLILQYAVARGKKTMFEKALSSMFIEESLRKSLNSIIHEYCD